jgi:WD40 repeat protein
MKSKWYSIGLFLSILILGVGVVFGQDADIISAKNASQLKQVVQMSDADKRIDDKMLVFSPDSKLLAFHQGENMVILDVATGKISQTLKYDTATSWAIFSADSKTLLGIHNTFLNAIKMWDVETGKALPDTVKTKDAAQSYGVYISPDGSLIAATHDDKTTSIIDATTGESVTTIPESSSSIGFSPDNKTIAIGDNNTKINLWDIASAKVSSTLNSPSMAYAYPVFSADGKLLAACNLNDGVDIWNVETGKVTLSMSDAGCGPGAAFSPDGSLLAAGFFSISVYDLAKGEELFKVDGASKAAFSPDGKYLATASNFENTITLWGL